MIGRNIHIALPVHSLMTVHVEDMKYGNGSVLETLAPENPPLLMI